MWPWLERYASESEHPGTLRQRLGFAFVILIGSGAAGLWYALQPFAWIGLGFYAAGLLAACFVLWPICAVLDNSFKGKTSEPELKPVEAVSTPTQCELKAPAKVVRRRARASQQTFDFDGMLALRALDSIDGAWLVAEASLEVIETVRDACRAAAPENVRMERWFEIVLALNAARHANDDKAEVRRSQVAEEFGVSEEQTRQIDQGRYSPLNRIIALIDPGEL